MVDAGERAHGEYVPLIFAQHVLIFSNYANCQVILKETILILIFLRLTLLAIIIHKCMSFLARFTDYLHNYVD